MSNIESFRGFAGAGQLSLFQSEILSILLISSKVFAVQGLKRGHGNVNFMAKRRVQETNSLNRQPSPTTRTSTGKPLPAEHADGRR